MFVDSHAHIDFSSYQPEEIEGLVIEPEQGIWIFDKTTYYIGDMRCCKYGNYCGVIGVYDFTDIEHLNLMVHHVTQATKLPALIDGCLP